ncbi:serine acetyltransferase 1, chloroplastic-like [Aristolochia californica]|uniref:serine acetyltransferase 1, chloroplastic-like n=1 Tax=Aristolochia californica TaxID=171875 RepID=UPI0035D705FB
MAASVDNLRMDASNSSALGDFSSTQMGNCKFKYWNISRPSFSDLASCIPVCDDLGKIGNASLCSSASCLMEGDRPVGWGGAGEDVWDKIREEARADVEQEPLLGAYYFSTVLSHNSLESALAAHLASKLSSDHLPVHVLLEVFLSVFSGDQEVKRAIREDLKGAKERDPACVSFVHCLLNFKGFLACQAHRVAYKLWTSGRRVMALLIQNRVTEVFAVDIHPAAKIGSGILFDHATGVVIGETAVIGDNVSILHNVTLGGTGKVSGDRHPKIGNGVLIGAGTQVLGNVRVGDGAKIGAGSVVLKEVPARTTAVGNPARLVGGKTNPIKLESIPSFSMDHTSFINDWSDYVI